MKIGIIIRQETADRCTAKGCMKAFFNKSDSFERYKGKDIELIAFIHSGGDLEYKINKMKENGVEAVHVSTCMRGKYENYEGLIKELSNDFHVVGYTHGSEQGKTRAALNMNKK